MCSVPLCSVLDCAAVQVAPASDPPPVPVLPAAPSPGPESVGSIGSIGSVSSAGSVTITSPKKKKFKKSGKDEVKLISMRIIFKYHQTSKQN